MINVSDLEEGVGWELSDSFAIEYKREFSLCVVYVTYLESEGNPDVWLELSGVGKMVKVTEVDDIDTLLDLCEALKEKESGTKE